MRFETEPASAERAEELDHQARAMLDANTKKMPATMAAEFQREYAHRGWSQYGPMPTAVQNALEHPGRIVGQDNKLYERNAQGQWVHDRFLLRNLQAGGPLHEALEATYQTRQDALQPVTTLETVEVRPSPEQRQEMNPLSQGPASPAREPSPETKPHPVHESPSVFAPQASAMPAHPRPHDPSPNDPRDPAHPDHAMYCQTWNGVRKAEIAFGKKTADKQTDQAAASLFVQAKREGLTQVDHVVFNPAGKDRAGNDIPANKYIFAVQGKLDALDMKRAVLLSAQAAATPEQESFQQLASINRELERQREQERQQAQRRGQDDPTRGGPKMG